MARYGNKKKKEEEEKKKKQQSVSARAMRNEKARQANVDKTVKSSTSTKNKNNKTKTTNKNKTTTTKSTTSSRKTTNRSSRTTGNNKGLFENSKLFNKDKNNNRTTKKSTTSKKGSALSDLSKKLYGDNDRLKRNTGTEKKTTENKQNTKQTTKKNSVTDVQTRSSKDARTDKLKNLTTGNLRQVVADHASALSSMRAENKEDYETPFKGKYSAIVQKPSYENTMKVSKTLSDWSQKQSKKAQKEIEKGKEGLGKVGQFAADVYGAGLGLAADAATGAAPVAMFSRAYGSAYRTAKEEGASHQQAVKYGLTKGAVEAATEKIGSVAKPLQKIYGKGVADDFAERVAKKMADAAKTQKSKDLAYHGGKTAAAFATEALEEMIAEGLDPAIANNIYAREVGKEHSTSAKDIAYAGLVGGALGGILGAGGQVVEYSQGSNVREIYGKDGAKALADIAKDSDDDGDALTAEALGKIINEGGGIAAGQALQLKKAVEKQNAKDRERIQIINDSARNVMRNEGLVDIIKKIDENGTLELSDNTRTVYEGAKAKAIDVVKNNKQMQLPDETVDEITSEVASIVTGAVTDIDTVNKFTTSNTLARQIYEQTTGETLPATNRETREYLYNKIGVNRKLMAEAETSYSIDRIKGGLQQDIAQTYDSNGQVGFSNVMKEVDVRNWRQVENAIVTFEDYYEAGRAGTSLQEMADLRNPVYDILTPQQKIDAHNAGVQDSISARNFAAGRAKDIKLTLGQKVELNQSQVKSVAPRGKVIYEFEDMENKTHFTASQQVMFQRLAQEFNINIHVTDNPNYNGNYVDGEMWLSVDADRELKYVFSHEITHHMEKFAPEEYNDFKELVRSAWGPENLNTAIRAKQAHYAKHGVNLSREAAIDEILADSTYEMIQDPAFVTEMCNEDRGLAKRILDSLRNLIAKIRAMLAGNDFTPAQNAGLLSQLDILKEAERLWEIGLKKAAENRDAVGVVGTSGEMQFSLNEFEDGRRFVAIDGDTTSFDGLSEREQGALATKIIKERFAGKVVGIDNRVFVNGRGAGEYGFPVKKLGPAEHDAKMRASTELDNIFDAGFGFRNKPDGADGHIHDDVIGGFDYFDAIFKIGEKYFQGTINIKNVKNGKLFKDLTKIKDVTKDISSSYGENPKSTFLRTSSMDSIPEDSENSNKKFSLKDQQFEIIQKTNPMLDDYHAGIRSADEILTFEEALQDSDYEGWEEDGFDPDYDGETAKQALRTGRITVFSSYPIENGVFVTPSRMEAESYSGTGDVHEMDVALEDVAWIDPTQGQYAKIQDSDSDIRFSFAGESAFNADNEMLKKAKEMYDDFENSEVIRKETGWHLGEDGKWRFEIDDSQMEVFPNGDAVYGKLNPGYVKLQELYDKFWESQLDEDEIEEFEKLEDLYGFEFGRLRRRLEDGNARLKDILQHDVLYANYPQLAEVNVQAKNLSPGTHGAYVVGRNKIVIDLDLLTNKYRKDKRNETLIHEIQHAIQEIESFAKGANVEMLDEAIANAELEYESARNLYDVATDNLGNLLYKSGYFDKYGDDVDITSSEEQNRIKHEDIADIEEVVDDFARYQDKYWESLAKLRDLKNMSAYDFYWYSAGEVEARDAGNRVTYNEAGRRDVRPDIDSPRIITEDYVRYSIRDDIEDQGREWHNHHGWAVTNTTPTDNEDIRFSFKDSFEDQVDGAIARTLDRNNHVYVGETPQILKDVGLHELPMLMTQKHIREINAPKNPRNAKNHGIDKAIIKKIPYYLEQPVAIMDSLSTTSQPSVIVLTEELDGDGNPIIVALKPNGKGFIDVEVESNFILTVFGKDNFANYWMNHVNEKTFLFIDNKKSKALFRKVQHHSLQSSNKKMQQQLLQSLNSFALDTIIRKSNNVVNKQPQYSIKDDLESQIDTLNDEIRAFDEEWKQNGISHPWEYDAENDRFIKKSGEVKETTMEEYRRLKDERDSKEQQVDELIDRIISLDNRSAAERINVSVDDVNEYVNAHPEEFEEVMKEFYSEQQAHFTRQQTIGELRSQLERMKADKKVTHGRVLDLKSIEEDVNSLVRMMLSYREDNTKLTDHKLVKMIQANAKDIFTYLKDGNQEEAVLTAYHAAEELVQNLNMVNDEMFSVYKELRDYLRNTRVYIPNEYLGDFPDLANFRKQQMGRIRLVNEGNGGTSVDRMYEQLLEMFPGMFDETLDNPADQMYEIRDVRDTLDPYEIVLSHEETEQLIKEAAHDILELAVNGKPWKSWADRNKEAYDKRIKALKQKHQEALRDVKKKEKERAEKKIEALRAKANERVQQTKEKGEQKLQEEKQKNKERQQKQRDAKVSREYVAKMEKQISWLSDRLLKPTDDKHLPEGYQKAIAQLLCTLDTQSERSKKLEEKYGVSQKRLKFLALKEQYQKLADQPDNDILMDEDIANDLSQLAEMLEDQTIAEATPQQLEQIYRVLRSITHGIRMVNQAFVEGQKATISEMAESTIEIAEGKKRHFDRTGMIGGMDSILNESMVTPRDFFERIGGGIEQAYIGIRKGFDRHVDNITTARKFFEGMFRKYYNKKKPGSAIEKWRDTSTNETFELDAGGSITLNAAQRMSLYCLMKREQAQGHILGSGIVATEVDVYSRIGKLFGAKIDVKATTARITWYDINNILETLTPEQIQIADELMGFLNNECAAWGNEVSMRLYGYKKFTEENYFPIKSADVYLDSKFDGRTSVERIRNFGFTKGTVVNANNPIAIDDIFTVVADHINHMSMYSGFAAPIADFTRVYNYKVRAEDGTITDSTKAVLQDAYGKKVGSYITKFMADLQSNTQTRSEGVTRLVNKTLANYKKATIAGNLRVALQQPTAIARAYMLIGPKYFTKLNVKKNMQRMKDHCQVARWKAWGHNQVDMARDIDDIMMNKEWTKLDLFTMQMYGWLDVKTWSYIWGAVEKETEKLHPEVAVDSEEYFQICNERASEIFDKTQVVDSVLHRSEVMRNQETMPKMVTSFMAEPTRTYNMVRGQYAKALDQWHDGEKGKATATAAKTTYIFLLNAMLCAMAAAVADALRGKDLDDDDEPEEWFEHVMNNFLGNANPLMMIPVLNETISYWQGWGSQNMALEGIESLITSTKALVDKMNGESDKTWGELFRKEAEAAGLVFGVPVKNILRELETFGKLIGYEASAATEKTESDSVPLLEKLDKLDIFSVKDGSFVDNILNRFGWNLTEAEKAERERQELIKEYEAKLEGLTGKDREEKLWKTVMDGYTIDLKNGDLAAIEERRKILEAMGGDMEHFEQKVEEWAVKGYRKSIGEDNSVSAVLKEFLKTEYGYTDGKISSEIIAKSDMAKQFQLALCTNDEDAAIEALTILREAGITYEDGHVLYLNKYKAIEASDYVTGEMSAPVSGRVTSTFGYRTAPTAGASTYHEGMDIAAPAGTVVGAADGGKVSSCGYNKTEGYWVKIDHGNGIYTEYKHLEGFCVTKGQPVSAGQEIGRVGSTGVSTGPHLHFSVKESGVYVDPAPYLN